MATQAENLNSQWRIWRQEVWIWAKLALQVWKLGTQIWSPYCRIMTHNLPFVITVKLMVKIKNLFRLKGGQGLYLDDVNIKQHLPLHGELQYQIRHLYSVCRQ